MKSPSFSKLVVNSESKRSLRRAGKEPPWHCQGEHTQNRRQHQLTLAWRLPRSRETAPKRLQSRGPARLRPIRDLT